MLEAYFDESGIEAGSRACVVAGFIADPGSWRSFETAWTTIAGDIPFHARRFFARDGSGCRVKPYQGWTDAQARAHLDALLDCIKATSLGQRGAVVDVEAFNALTDGERDFLTGGTFDATEWKYVATGAPTKPYYVAFQSAATRALAMAHFLKCGPVNFVFDQQEQYAAHAIKTYQNASLSEIREMTAQLGTIRFLSKASVPGLQAADLLAHVQYRLANAAGVGRHESDLRMAVDRLHALDRDNGITALDTEAFRRLLKLPAAVRERIRRGQKRRPPRSPRTLKKARQP